MDILINEMHEINVYNFWPGRVKSFFFTFLPFREALLSRAATILDSVFCPLMNCRTQVSPVRSANKSPHYCYEKSREEQDLVVTIWVIGSQLKSDSQSHAHSIHISLVINTLDLGDCFTMEFRSYICS